jgi:hypothetical protein
MLSAQEFRIQAEECRRIAESTRDKEDRRVWNGMADRWLLCARLADEEYAVLEPIPFS